MRIVTLLLVLVGLAYSYTDSLKATYKFQNNLSDSCGRWPNMTATNSTFVLGVKGMAATGILTVPVPSGLKSSWSVSYWIKSSSANGLASRIGLWCNIWGNKIEFKDDIMNPTPVTSGTLQSGWNHVAIVNDGTIRVYLNSILIGTGGSYNLGTTMAVSSRDIAIDELKVWISADNPSRGALSQADVNQLYSQVTSVVPTIRPSFVQFNSSPAIYNIKGQVISGTTTNLILNKSIHTIQLH